MKIDVSLDEELFDCPEIPEGINPYHLSPFVDGQLSLNVFAIDTESGIVKQYKTKDGSDFCADESGHPIVEEIKYKTLHVMWDNRAGVTGEHTFFGEGV